MSNVLRHDASTAACPNVSDEGLTSPLAGQDERYKPVICEENQVIFGKSEIIAKSIGSSSPRTRGRRDNARYHDYNKASILPPSEPAMSLLQNPFDPASETALVTGAGNGIGRAIAQALVGEGVRTVFADVSAERVAAAIVSSPKPELAVPFVGDLGKREVCDALLAEAKKSLGHVTHFVHSASPPRREVDHAFAVDQDTWRQMHAVNL